MDLAVVLAVVSSHRGTATHAGIAALGEIGLAGELRAVPSTAQRVREAQRLGFDRCLIPDGRGMAGVEGAVTAANLRQALELALP